MTSTKDNDLLLERIWSNASKTPDKLAITFLSSGPDGGKIQTQWTYAQLTEQVEGIAQSIGKAGLRQGDRAVLVYPPSADYMAAFLACLMLGIIAVPVFPPNPSRKDTLEMFCRIVEGCDAKHALTNTTYNHAKKLSSLQQQTITLFQKKKKMTTTAGRSSRATTTTGWPEDLKWIVTNNNNYNNASSKKDKEKTTPFPKLTATDLAFLQYTSGSTSSPKGVMITHGNLAHNLTIITQELDARSDTIVVSWLPQYHDMGLIGSYLGCLYCGGSGYYMSPLTFLQRPMIWMEAISNYHATHLQAPNFAFALTARKAREDYSMNDDDDNNDSKSLDLSSVRHVINAAEPVTEQAMDAFVNVFEQYGFQSEVLFPTYGLAEHTVFVCSGGEQRLTVDKQRLEVQGKVREVWDGDDDDDTTIVSTRLVGCGYPRSDVDVKIVDRDSCRVLGEDEVGEIWISSPSKAAGYFHQPEETKQDFQATLDVVADGSNQSCRIKYLRTGDLGFFHEDELFICGRLKDLIIVGGRNYYPQDLEATAEATDPERIRAGCCAAFSVDPTNHQEEVAMVLEVRDSVLSTSKADVKSVYNALVEGIKSAITQEHSLGIVEIVLLKPKTVPKTTSGKIARAWCRKAYLAQTLDVVYRKSFRGEQQQQEEGTTTKKSSLEIESSSTPRATTTTSSNNNNIPASRKLSPQDVQRLRAMSNKDIMAKLKQDVARMGSLSSSDTIATDVALSTIMDSITISQFHGLLESNYAVKLSDEYLFRENTTLNKLVEVVKLGYAPDDNGGEDGGGAVVAQSSSSRGGIAGALGCPPGVRCVIL